MAQAERNIVENGTDSTEDAKRHYVYIYRDENEKVRYVGYGKNPERAQSNARSDAMAAFQRNRKHTIEIAGPYGSRQTGLAVETALISSHNPDLNSALAPGSQRWRFRSLGVPAKYAERLSQNPLQREDLSAFGALPALFVRISDRDFEDRPGYLPDKPLPNHDIVKRMEAWWQIGRHVEIWKEEPEKSPRLLIAVTGTTSHRIIIACVLINRDGWKNATPERGFYKVPLANRSDLDAFELRGRLLSPMTDIKFGAIKPHFFVILDESGNVVAGRK